MGGGAKGMTGKVCGVLIFTIIVVAITRSEEHTSEHQSRLKI